MRWEDLIRRLEAFGKVHVLVSNGAATLDAIFTFAIPIPFKTPSANAAAGIIAAWRGKLGLPDVRPKPLSRARQ
jgi:hypothetical protein